MITPRHDDQAGSPAGAAGGRKSVAGSAAIAASKAVLMAARTALPGALAKSGSALSIASLTQASGFAGGVGAATTTALESGGFQAGVASGEPPRRERIAAGPAGPEPAHHTHDAVERLAP